MIWTSITALKSPPLLPIPNQTNEAHKFISCFFKIYFNIILRLCPQRALSDQNAVSISHSSHYCDMISPSYIYLITLITFGEDYNLWSSSLRKCFQPFLNSCILGPNILLSTLFSNTLKFVFLPEGEIHTHPHNATVKIMVLSRIHF
jgi:hypothetical protein